MSLGQSYVIDFDIDAPNISIANGQSATVTGNVLDFPALTDAGFDYTIDIEITGGPVTNTIFPIGTMTAASQFNNGDPSVAINGGMTTIDLDLEGHAPPISTAGATPATTTFYRDPSTQMEVTLTLDNGCSFENLTYTLADIDYTFNDNTQVGEPNDLTKAFSYIDRVKVISGAGTNVYTPVDPSKVWIQGDDLIAQFTDANGNGIPDVSDYGLIPGTAPDGNVTVYNPGNIGTDINFIYDDYSLGIEGDADGLHDFDALNLRVGLGTGITFDKRAVNDLALEKTISTNSAMLGDIITFTIDVTNQGALTSTGVTVTDVFPVGLTYTGTNTAPAGTTFNGSVWNIGTITAGQTMTLTVDAEVTQEGVFINQAEISTMNEPDSDSTPGNLEPFEDDYSTACVTVPIQVCDNQPINVTLQAPTNYGMYQWYLDGNPIAGATTATYTAMQVGEYTYTSDGGVLGDCVGELCCPIQITTVECCPPKTCVPITISVTPN